MWLVYQGGKSRNPKGFKWRNYWIFPHNIWLHSTSQVTPMCSICKIALAMSVLSTWIFIYQQRNCQPISSRKNSGCKYWFLSWRNTNVCIQHFNDVQAVIFFPLNGFSCPPLFPCCSFNHLKSRVFLAVLWITNRGSSTFSDELSKELYCVQPHELFMPVCEE